MEAVLVPPPLARSIRLCFTGGQVRVIGVASVAFGDFEFSAQAKTGAARTINKLQLSQEWRVQSEIFDIHGVHAN